MHEKKKLVNKQRGVTIVAPPGPIKRPKKPAVRDPNKGSKTINRYIKLAKTLHSVLK